MVSEYAKKEIWYRLRLEPEKNRLVSKLSSMGKKNCSELLGELKCWLETLEEHPVDGAER